MTGSSARAEERIRDTYSIELIEQKIHESAAALKAAKYGLASLIQRERTEQSQITALELRVSDLMQRAAEALKGERQDLAQQAAQAIADMENELVGRRGTLCRLETRILQLRQSVEAANRRLIDLRQGAVAAKAVRQEQILQKRLSRHVGAECAMDEAAELIAKVMQKEDPFEQGEILRQIDSELSHESIQEKLSDAGFGEATKTTAADVLGRLQT